MRKKLLASILCAVLFFACTSCVMPSGTTSTKESTSESTKGSSSDKTSTSEKESEEQKPKIQIKPEKNEFLFVMDGNQEPAEIKATVTVDGELVEAPKLSYTVENPEICELNNNVISPKKAGRTDVTVAYGEEKTTVAVLVSEPIAKNLVNTFDERAVNVYGRTYIKDNKLCLDNIGAGLGVAIYGEELSVTVESIGSNYLCIFIDGEQEYSSRIGLSSGTKTYKIAQGLEAGFHTVRMVKSNEIDDGVIKIKDVSSSAFYTAPEKSPLLIEFIGDSITTGYGVLGNRGAHRTIENSDGCSAFAYKTASLLGADYSIIAKQGICVKGYLWRQESMMEIYKYLSTYTNEEYSFERKADIVVINLGTNDSGLTPNFVSEFPNDYCDFLRIIRANYPDAHIVCLYGFMGLDSKIKDGINTAASKMQDDKVYTRCGSYSPNTGAGGGHPSKQAQSEWAMTLADFITSYIL